MINKINVFLILLIFNLYNNIFLSEILKISLIQVDARINKTDVSSRNFIDNLEKLVLLNNGNSSLKNENFTNIKIYVPIFIEKKSFDFKNLTLNNNKLLKLDFNPFLSKQSQYLNLNRDYQNHNNKINYKNLNKNDSFKDKMEFLSNNNENINIDNYEDHKIQEKINDQKNKDYIIEKLNIDQYKYENFLCEKCKIRNNNDDYIYGQSIIVKRNEEDKNIKESIINENENENENKDDENEDENENKDEYENDENEDNENGNEENENKCKNINKNSNIDKRPIIFYYMSDKEKLINKNNKINHSIKEKNLNKKFAKNKSYKKLRGNFYLDMHPLILNNAYAN